MTPRLIPVGQEPPPMNGQDEPVSSASRRKEKPASRGRFQSINAFLDVTMASLDRAELAVWLLLWRDTKPNGLARTSQTDLARRAGCHPRTVRRALMALQEKQLLAIVRQGGLSRGLSVYR